MDHTNDRLRQARQKAGYKSAAAAARAFGWNEVTYRHHENGTRGFDTDHARSYSRAFRTEATWLMGLDPSSALDFKAFDLPDNRTFVPTDLARDAKALESVSAQFDVTFLRHMAAGKSHERPWMPNLLSDGEDLVAFPTSFLSEISKVSPRHCFSMVFSGSYMAPAVRDGAHIIIDGGRTEIDVQDDLWLLWQSGSHFVRRIRRQPDGKLLLLTDSSSSPPQELPTEAFYDDGFEALQMVGKVVWIGQAP